MIRWAWLVVRRDMRRQLNGNQDDQLNMRHQCFEWLLEQWHANLFKSIWRLRSIVLGVHPGWPTMRGLWCCEKLRIWSRSEGCLLTWTQNIVHSDEGEVTNTKQGWVPRYYDTRLHCQVARGIQRSWNVGWFVNNRAQSWWAEDTVIRVGNQNHAQHQTWTWDLDQEVCSARLHTEVRR